jgi:hypothetical protein
MLDYAQSQGAERITLNGRYATEEGAMLGTVRKERCWVRVVWIMLRKIFPSVSPATREGLKGFLKGLEK